MSPSTSNAPSAKVAFQVVTYTVLMFVGTLLLFDASVTSALGGSVLSGIFFGLVLWWTDRP